MKLKDKADGRWRSNCGTGVCRNLRRVWQETIATEHFTGDCDPDFGEVVVGGTHKTCRNTCYFGCKVVEGEDARI